MNKYRKLTTEDVETARQARERQYNLPPDERLKEQLADLLIFVSQLAHTPHGKADLVRRVQMFGNCTHTVGESQRYYYGKLRYR